MAVLHRVKYAECCLLSGLPVTIQLSTVLQTDVVVLEICR